MTETSQIPLSNYLIKSNAFLLVILIICKSIQIVCCRINNFLKRQMLAANVKRNKINYKIFDRFFLNCGL